jgi:SAM-dependent methyltransferase
VNREGGRWALAPKGRATLVPGSPVYQGHAIAHAGEVQPVWNDLAEHLRGRAGWSQFVEEGETPRRSHADFVLAMHEMAMAGRAAELAARVDLAGCRTLIDVGGGPGTYAMALCERWPDLRATVLDLPETVAIAREVIGGFGTGERVHAAIGDWDSDEFGRDADAALLSNILHGPTSRAEMKLAKAWRALRPGGRLIIQDFLLNDEKTGPLAPALFNIMVGAFSRKELADRIVAAGFLGPHFQAMPEDLDTSLAVAVRPQ